MSCWMITGICIRYCCTEVTMTIAVNRWCVIARVAKVQSNTAKFPAVCLARSYNFRLNAGLGACRRLLTICIQ